jgi:molecular chaperone DnaK
VREELADVVEVNVTAHSLGVEVRHQGRRVNDILIAKNTQLPASAARVYRTIRPGQRRVRVLILQGEAPQAEACIRIGECWIDELPLNLPQGAPVEVRCGCAANGLVEVLATDQTSGRAARARIQRTGGLTDDEIERESAWVRGLRIQ